MASAQHGTKGCLWKVVEGMDRNTLGSVWVPDGAKSTSFYLITYRVWWTVAVAISWVISFIISAKAWSAPNSSLKGPEIIWSVQRGLWPPGRCLTRWGATRLCPRPASGTWSWWSFPLPLPSASFCQQICRDKPKLYHKDKYIQGVPKKVWLSFKCS